MRKAGKMNNKTWQKILILGAILVVGSSAAAGEKFTVVHPEDTGEALVNPGMGWGFHYYSNVPTNYGSKLMTMDTLDYFPGLSHIYLRIPWAYLEPAEGRFDWSVLDIPAQRWIDKGVQIALRISCSESWMRYATPEWVCKAGAKGYNFTVRKGVDPNGPFWEPDFKDPVFLAKLDKFLAALAERYDGSPDVAFIDIGSFGVWGEGHTLPSTKLKYDYRTRKIHVDLHCKHFKETLLVINDDFAGPYQQGRNLPITDYALSKGLALRDDSIMAQGGKNAYFHADLAQSFWPILPVILECGHYGPLKKKGNWQDGSLYLKAMEDYHASYASIHWWPREFLEANRDLVRRMNLRLGYRLQLVEASWPDKIDIDSQLVFSGKWRNAGVAPCLPGGYPALTLKDSTGGIVGLFVDDDFDMRMLSVDKPGKAKIIDQQAGFVLSPQLLDGYRPGIREAGTYEVYISVGSPIGTPHIALPLLGDDGHRRYKLGTVRVVSGQKQ
jgi:hypothetical protein